MKIIFLVLFFLSQVTLAQSLKVVFFDTEDVTAFKSYMSNSRIHYIVESEMPDRIKIKGSFFTNQYELTKVLNGIELVKRGLPLSYKTPDLIYLDIFISLYGKMEHINQALKEMPLFSIYLNSYNYSGAIDCVNKASGYLTMSEQKAILNAIPKP